MDPLLRQTVAELKARLASGHSFDGGQRLSFDEPPGPPPADPVLRLGRRIYYNACVYCHGVEGRGASILLCPRSPLVGDSLTRGIVLASLRQPRFPMPPVRLVPREQEAVADYVMSLVRRPATESNTSGPDSARPAR